MEIHNVGSLTEPERLENQNDDFDFKSERSQELLIDELQGIPKEDLCFHEPHQTDLVNWEQNGDEIIQIFQCECGKEVTELFRLSERKVS